MNVTLTRKVAGVATLALTGMVLYTGHTPAVAKAAVKAKPAAGSVTQGKALVSQYRCNGCHNADLSGKPGFSPSLHLSGAMHDYTQAQFVKLMHTGITNDGRPVKKPMPTYAQMPTAQAVSIFAYLHTLK